MVLRILRDLKALSEKALTQPKHGYYFPKSHVFAIQGRCKGLLLDATSEFFKKFFMDLSDVQLSYE